MRVEYSKRALADLRKVVAESLAYGDVVATAVEARIHDVIAQIADLPERAPSVIGRPDVRVVLLFRYPYKLFYRIQGDRLRVLHIRHTSRRRW